MATRPYRTARLGGERFKVDIMFFVYILYSDSFDRFYIGMAEDIDRRLDAHNKGMVKSTKAFLHWRVINVDSFNTRLEARKEKNI